MPISQCVFLAILFRALKKKGGGHKWPMRMFLSIFINPIKNKWITSVVLISVQNVLDFGIKLGQGKLQKHYPMTCLYSSAHDGSAEHAAPLVIVCPNAVMTQCRQKILMLTVWENCVSILSCPEQTWCSALLTIRAYIPQIFVGFLQNIVFFHGSVWAGGCRAYFLLCLRHVLFGPIQIFIL